MEQVRDLNIEAADMQVSGRRFASAISRRRD